MKSRQKLTVCPECGKEYSRRARRCPWCDAKNRKRKRFPVLPLLLVLVLAAAGISRIGGKPDTHKAASAPQKTAAAAVPTAKPTAEPAAAERTAPEPTEAPEEEKPTELPAEKGSGGISPEFRQMMEEYEDFMDEYVLFMEKYQANSSDLSLMMEYLELLGEYEEFAEKIEALDKSEMTDAEALYYLEVTNRVNQKLLGTLAG